MEKIGFVGLGIMGAPMAGHLLDAGFEVVASDHRGALPAELVGKGLKSVSGYQALAKAADVIILMVPDTPQVADVLFGENSVASGLSKGKLVIDMSSISPIETKEFARKINELGCDYLDAPVSGGEVGAKAASLTIMVGGEEKPFERARPVFEKMGKNITLVGTNGVGQTTKVANQIVVALTIEAVAEALLFASKAGADPAKVRQALMGGLAASRILEVHGERMYKRTFAPGFRIELHQKDLNLALQGAKALGVSLPNTSMTQELFNSCAANGGAKEDHSALVRALERMANFEIGADVADAKGKAA
ncbi:2-hydroxy-3-oxopropionate reductase [Aminobacter niigataensis]|uniref:2-hydroxy-3-oxopropionate reductase n=1 Tax=Aminobacter niigataensis TaxID=83265 RepID=A0ABR6KY19_9HYPH|nr:2-hydroxy-3-oxopropionate reductase [Aminobacter niigataensis]MBB4649429.1 2-hydroxy-3-oxopropionate reductase [Aminobacter niigataensis]